MLSEMFFICFPEFWKLSGYYVSEKFKRLGIICSFSGYCNDSQGPLT
jgi:hypothetical protein